MTPPVGTKITARIGDEFAHGRVCLRNTKAGLFAFRHYVYGTRVDGMIWEAATADEGATWTPGWLLWWWPPHRRQLKAMRAAYAIDAGYGVQLPEEARRKQEQQFNAFQRNVDKYTKAMHQQIESYMREINTYVERSVQRYTHRR